MREVLHLELSSLTASVKWPTLYSITLYRGLFPSPLMRHSTFSSDESRERGNWNARFLKSDPVLVPTVPKTCIVFFCFVLLVFFCFLKKFYSNFVIIFQPVCYESNVFREPSVSDVFISVTAPRGIRSRVRNEVQFFRQPRVWYTGLS